MSGMFPSNQIIEIFGEELSWPGVGPDGKFTNGSFSDPAIKPSFIPSETINLILDNLQAVVSDAGLTPNSIEADQLARALQAMFQEKLIMATDSASGLLKSSSKPGKISVDPETGEAELNGPPDIHYSRVGKPGAFEDFMRGFLRPHSGAVFDPIYVDGPAHGKGANAFSGATLLPDDNVLLVPIVSPNIGIYNPKTGQYTDGPAHGKGADAFSGGVLLPDGNVLLAPRSSPNIGIYNPRAGQYTDGPAHGKGAGVFFGVTLLPDGNVLLAPRSSPNIGIVRLAGLDVGLGYCLHPYFAKF